MNLKLSNSYINLLLKHCKENNLLIMKYESGNYHYYMINDQDVVKKQVSSRTEFKEVNKSELLTRNMFLERLSNESRINLDAKILKEFLPTLLKQELAWFYKNIMNILLTSDADKYCEILRELPKEINEELFKKTPRSMLKLGKYQTSKSKKILEEASKLFDLDTVAQFFSNRASQINASEQAGLEFRDLILDYYHNDLEKIKKFSDVRAIKEYLNVNENSNFFLDDTEEKTATTELINVEKMKAVLAIPKWRNEDYHSALCKFMNLFDEKYENIHGYAVEEIKVSKKDNYISVIMFYNKDAPIDKQFFRKKVLSFGKFLASKNVSSYEIHKLDLSSWWHSDELNEKLNAKEVSTKKMKI